MKKLFVIFSLILLFSGCSVVHINEQSYEEIVNDVLKEDFNIKNVSFSGYSYYLPKGVLLKKNHSLNSVLYYNHKKMYLYVDLLSYYHKVKNDYETSKDNYYSLKIDQNGKQGYLEITKISTKYFVEFMYNYAKVEAYVEEEDLKKTITQIAYILNSIRYQDTVLSTLIGDNSLDYNEENFNIFKATREEGSFLDYEEQDRSQGDEKIKDENKLEIEDKVE